MKPRNRVLLALVGLLAILFGSGFKQVQYLTQAFANTLYARQDGVNTPSTLYVDASAGSDATGKVGARFKPYKTFAAAYAAASSGQTIRLLPGTYTFGANLVQTKALTVIGEPGVVVTGSYLWDCQASLALRDVKFSGFGGIYLGNLPGKVDFDVRSCEFDSGVAGIYTPDATIPSISTGFNRAKIQNCRFTNLSDVAMRIGVGCWDEMLVDGNVVRNVQRRGIQVGGNADYTYESVRQKTIVTHNAIDGVTDSLSPQPAGNTCNGIIVYGQYAVISSNDVMNVTRVNQQVDCEGIYTKASYSTIANNVVVDAGQGEGSIDIKGRPQNAYQTFTFTGFANADTFTLTLGTDTTSAIAYDGTSSTTFQTVASNVKSALEALPSIGSGNVLVSVQSYSSKTLSVEFVGSLANTVVGALSGAAVSPSTGTLTFTYPQQQHGYATTCIGNVVRCTAAAPYPCKGITIKNERILVVNNRIEGTTFGVSTSSADDCRDATIVGNEIYNIVRTTGATAGVQILSNADGMRIINNRIKGVSGGTANHAGVKIGRLGDQIEIRGNVISGVVGGSSATCIRLNEDNDGPIQVCTISENTFGSDTAYGIRLAGPVDNLVVTNNRFLTTTTSKMILWTAVPTILNLSRNTGLISEARGSSTISVGSTTRNINHTLNLPTGKATASMITLTVNGSTASTGMPYVSAVTDTQFTVTVPVAPSGSALSFTWTASCPGSL